MTWVIYNAEPAGTWKGEQLCPLGRRGVGDIIERTCRYASRCAEGLSAAGYEILSDVELNEVLVSFGEPEVTRRVFTAL